MKQQPVSRFSKAKAGPRDDESWHNGGDIEIDLYARSLHRAARALVETLDLKATPRTAWNGCPVILLYRQAVELRLKALVGEGSNFLPSPTDSITLYKTHSLRWLAQLVCQIIRKVHWENEFRCEGVATLADFSSVVGELEALDPVAWAVRSSSRRRDGSVPRHLEPSNVVRFAAQLDALLDLLDVTADALAATGDLQREGTIDEVFIEGDDIKHTIH